MNEYMKPDSQFKKPRLEFNPNYREQSWEDIAHELAWGVMLIESEPTRIKSWNTMFNIMKRYEDMCKRHGL